MKKITYKDLENALKNREDVVCSSVKAVNKKGIYLVYSFETVIAVKKNGKWYLNEHNYSSTTSKIQNIVKEVSRSWVAYLNEEDFYQCLNLQ